MISSFFDKTKPINFLVLLGFVMLLFWVVTFKFYGFHLEYGQIFRRILGSIALVLSVFLLGNMVKSKKLTMNNSFAMLFFSILFMVFFFALADTNIVFALTFLMISWDRTLALRSEKNHKEKIFESALWLFVASLFVEWTLLYLIPLYIAISLFCGKQLRLWLMPLAAFFCISILVVTATVLFNGLGFFQEHYWFPLSLDFFLKPNYGVIIYIIFVFVIVFIVFGKLGYRRLGRTLSLRLVFAYLVTSIVLLVFTGNQENRMVVFSFFPAAIFLTNYIESFKKQKRKELFAMACIVLPFLGFVVRLFQ